MITNLSEKTNAALRFLGITRNTVAYSILYQAMELIDEDRSRLQAVEKQIYIPIADKRFGYSKAIQSAIRAAAKKAWTICPDRLQKLAGYPLNKCPSAVPFLEIIYNAIASMDYSIRSEKINFNSIL